MTIEAVWENMRRCRPSFRSATGPSANPLESANMSPRPPDPELQAVSIVALGSFNPTIYQPLWFAGRNLITKEEADQAKVEIIHKQVSVFSLEWLSLQVTGERFAIQTADPGRFRPLHDLMVGTFKVLEHTPITAFGFNGDAHYKMASVGDWNAFGYHYAPKKPWDDILSNPGLSSLIIMEKDVSQAGSRRRVRIGPSREVKPGVYVSINEHYELKENMSQSERIAHLLEKLAMPWETFLEYRHTVWKHLFDEYEASGEVGRGN